MNVTIKWIGLDKTHNAVTEFSNVKEINPSHCCYFPCYHLKFSDGKPSVVCHEVQDIITDGVEDNFWYDEKIDGNLNSTYRLIKPVVGCDDDSDVLFALGQYKTYHEKLNHRWVADSSLPGGYFVDQDGNGYLFK